MSTATLPSEHPFGTEWAALLSEAPPNWVTAYLCGLQAHARADNDAARESFTFSVEHQDNPWARRALAVLHLADGHVGPAADEYVRAHQQEPHLPSLSREVIKTLIQAGRPQEARAILGSLAEPVRRRGRFRMLEAQAAAAAGQTQRARELLDSGVVVDDLREGETALSDLWEQLHPESVVPEQYDFRMVPEQPHAHTAPTDPWSSTIDE